MKNEKLILTDCDGILLNWVEGFSKFMANQGHIAPDNTKYSIGARYGITETDGTNLVKFFNASPEISTLGAIKSAVSAVRKLHFIHGYRFDVITSLSGCPKAAALRKRNLYEVFGPEPFNRIVCLPLESSKIPTLREYAESDLVWIEDSPKNALDGADLGLHSILLKHPYNNGNYPSLPQFDNWTEIYDYIVANS